MSDYLFNQYRRRGGNLSKDAFEDRQEFIKENFHNIIISCEVTIGEFCAACSDVIAESAEKQTGEIAYAFSLALDVSEDIGGVALERGKGGNA